jgi:alkanesulfonate monooxygenase SsuD/methylene tetrahydromethanopterin reductase-like flavin-dependent oxidoreductase (luciferase family)
MKYGIQLVQAWSPGNGVNNVSAFLLKAAEEAESAGWDGFFLWDHLYFTWAPCHMPDSWSVLSAAAARTDRITLGTTVTALPRRRPQVLAKQLVTVDQISGGRVVLGVGLGGSGEGGDAGDEFTSFGEESRYRVMGRMADEALEVITRLWSGEQVNYMGKHFKVENAVFLPRPVQKPRIPIWVGAFDGPALKRVAKYDGWVTTGPCPSVNLPGYSFEKVHEKMGIIEGYRKTDWPFDLVYGYEFPTQVIDEEVSKAESVGVTWMLDIISAMRFKGNEALDYIRRGPPG